MARENYDIPSRPSRPYEDKKKEANVATPNPQYEEMMERWELPIDLMGGTQAMKGAGKRWLPQEPRESWAAYKNRLNRTVLYNAYKRTVQVLSGLPFVRAVIVDNVPADLEYIEKDCDSDGSDITDFSHTLLEDCIHYGLSHIYVDMPYVESAPTLAEREEYKIRPYFTRVCPANVISWDSEKIGGRDVLTRLRIKESSIEDDGEWGYKEVERIRVIYQDKYEIHEEVEKNKWSVVEEGPNDLGFIPLLTVYGNKTGFMQAEPPLEDLAWLNLRHYQKVSDLDNIEHVANVPVLFGAGFADGELEGAEIGPNRAITASDAQASLQYVEHTGAAIGASRQSVKDLEERMSSLGSDLIIRKSVDRQTATARKIDQSESISLLQIMVNNIETVVEQAYYVAGKWLGIEVEDIVVTIADNLDTVDGPNTSDLLLSYLMDTKQLTYEQAAQELKRRGALSDRFKYEGGETLPEELEGEEQEEEGSSEIEENPQQGETPETN